MSGEAQRSDSPYSTSLADGVEAAQRNSDPSPAVHSSPSLSDPEPLTKDNSVATPASTTLPEKTIFHHLPPVRLDGTNIGKTSPDSQQLTDVANAHQELLRFGNSTKGNAIVDMTGDPLRPLVPLRPLKSSASSSPTNAVTNESHILAPVSVPTPVPVLVPTQVTSSSPNSTRAPATAACPIVMSSKNEFNTNPCAQDPRTIPSTFNYSTDTKASNHQRTIHSATEKPALAGMITPSFTGDAAVDTKTTPELAGKSDSAVSKALVCQRVLEKGFVSNGESQTPKPNMVVSRPPAPPNELSAGSRNKSISNTLLSKPSICAKRLHSVSAINPIRSNERPTKMTRLDQQAPSVNADHIRDEAESQKGSGGDASNSNAVSLEISAPSSVNCSRKDTNGMYGLSKGLDSLKASDSLGQRSKSESLPNPNVSTQSSPPLSTAFASDRELLLASTCEMKSSPNDECDTTTKQHSAPNTTLPAESESRERRPEERTATRSPITSENTSSDTHSVKEMEQALLAESVIKNSSRGKDTEDIDLTEQPSVLLSQSVRPNCSRPETGQSDGGFTLGSAATQTKPSSLMQISSSYSHLSHNKFEGHVETSTRGGHRVFAEIRGQKMVGWVVPLSRETGVFADDVLPMEKSASIEPTQDDTEKIKFPRDVVSLSRRCAFASDVPQRSVIVIGAGIAGIAAARALADRGFQVVVLEARGRLGGRIATDWSMGSPVELGACFIHGSFGNPLAMIAREASLRTYTPKDMDNLIYSNGEQVSSADDHRAEEVWRALTKRAERLAENVLQKHEKDMSLGSLLRKLSKTLQQDLSPRVEQLLSWHASNLELACAADLDDLSATHYDMDVQHGFSGPHEVVRDGYSSIIHALAKNLDVRLNVQVSTIHHNISVQLLDDITINGNSKVAQNDEHRASKVNVRRSKQSAVNKKREKLGRQTGSVNQVRYLDKSMEGSGMCSHRFGFEKAPPTSSSSAVRVSTKDGFDFVAEWCIVTVPLGVLQSGDIKFDPVLPMWKQEAIERIGFGVVNKVVLRFDKAFWMEGEYASALNGDVESDGDTNDRERGENYGAGVDYIGRVTDKHGVFTMFLSMVRITGAPILVGIIAGKFAEFVEGQGDVEVADMALQSLKEIYGQNQVGRLVDWRVTRWATDPFSRGSYSYARVGSTPADYMRMSLPVDRVLFAGEATHRKHPATAHGAFMSGVREAARIIRHCSIGSKIPSMELKEMLEQLALMEEPSASASTDSPKVRRGAQPSWRRNGRK